MPMDPTSEPSKWVCRLVSHFPGVANTVSGSGFLVNIPFTQKHCIITAGHNIVRPDEGQAERVEVFFPNNWAFIAEVGELFVSSVYAKSPTLSDRNPISVNDYALIAIDQGKQRADPGMVLGGCSLSVLPSRSELLHTGGTVYGYSLGNVLQTKDTSPFARPVHAHYLEYEKDTEPGVSGGPIFVSYEGGDVAIGIHNYNGRATRLTVPVMMEILSWVPDYGLDRTFEDLARRGVFLQSTTGPVPKIIGRPGKGLNAVFKLVAVYIAKENSLERDHRFVILQLQKHKPGTYFFLTAEGSQVTLKEGTAPLKENTFSIWSKKKKNVKTLALASDPAALILVKPTQRARCDCGCISQDDMVGVETLRPTLFDISAWHDDT